MTTPLYKFTDEASAQADPAVGPLYESGAWRGDVCIPGVQVTDDQGNPVSGWFIRIAGPVLNDSAVYSLPEGWLAQPDFAS